MPLKTARYRERTCDQGASYSTCRQQDGHRTGPTGLFPGMHRQERRYAKVSLARLTDGETPQPAATGAHSTAGMGHRREGTPSNSNFLTALHSSLEQAHEVQGP